MIQKQCTKCGEDYDSTTIHICPPDAADKLAEMIVACSGDPLVARAFETNTPLIASAVRAAIDEAKYPLEHRMNCAEDDTQKLQQRVEQLEKAMYPNFKENKESEASK